MPLIKHVVEEVFFPVFADEENVIETTSELIAREVEMTPEEEAEWLASLPEEVPAIPEPAQPTKAQLLAEVHALLAKIEALNDA